MKKVMMLCMVVMCSTGLYAQPKFGARLALVESSVSNSDSKIFTGFHAGFFAQIDLNRALFFRLEIAYLLKGSKPNFAPTGHLKIPMHNLSVPLMAGYKIKEKLHVYLGPQIDFLIKSTFKTPSGSADYTDFYKRPELSAAAGVSYRIKPKLDLDLRFVQGLSLLQEIEVTDGLGNITEVVKRRSTVFQLGLSYSFN